MNSQKRNIIIGIAVLVLLGGLYMFFDKSKREEVAITPTEEIVADVSTTTIVNIGGVNATIPKGYTVEMVGALPQPMPSLTRQPVFAATVDTSTKTVIQSKISGLQALLKKEAAQFAPWIDLGTYFKIAGDYEGAKLYWNYAGKLAPTDFISFGNLGNMYAYQLKDMVTAEKYYNQAIKNGPTQVYLYVQLAESYRDVSKDLTKARATVDRGLAAIPNDRALLELKANLK
jgi:tetratricopeptide (TPR) repeat protein